MCLLFAVWGSRENARPATERNGLGAFALEKSTVIGIIMGIISIFVGMILKGAPLSALNNPAAFLIIIGGTFSCLFIGFRMEQLGNFVNLIKKTCQVPQLQEKGQLVQQFIELSQIARREGILALESKAQEIEDPFFRTGLGMVIDGAVCDVDGPMPEKNDGPPILNAAVNACASACIFDASVWDIAKSAIKSAKSSVIRSE